jgi:hypothetical protein
MTEEKIMKFETAKTMTGAKKSAMICPVNHGKLVANVNIDSTPTFVMKPTFGH